jgi:UDP-N-acetylglucosamine--N-acetylmuramyl-(pentapeptide) pyrophosphoryl-undecaprenol N-acetylglucosamine transferase
MQPGPIYIGNSRGMERILVPRTGIPCFFFPMAAPRSARGVLLLVLAAVRSMAVMLRSRPTVTVATGGYVSAPVALASWLARIPIVLFLPDVVPGKAVGWLAPMARRIAVTTPASIPYLPAGKAAVTGYPVRQCFYNASGERGRRRLGIPADAKVLCVFGGSQGARSINEAVAASLPELLDRFWVIHICGEQRHAEALEAAAYVPSPLRSRYLLFPYLHDENMADALAASDLALCRSGASTLGELPMVGTPAILAPLPEPNVHQRENADCLAGAGAAVVVDDGELKARLSFLVNELLLDPKRLRAMSNACHDLARLDAARAIATLVRESQ